MTDAQIVSAVLDGETGQFEVLVERYAGMVRGLCAAHVGGDSAQEDLAQEVFIDGYVKLGHLRRKDRFGPWLARIARNKCKSWLRREVTRRRVYNSVEAQAETPPPGVLAALDRAELRAIVHQAIGGLPGKTREAMMLCYVEGVTIREAAQFLKVSEAAVKKRLEYGRRLVSDGLWEVMAERGAQPEPQRALKKRVLAAIAVTTLPARAGFGAWVVAKTASLGLPAAAIPAILLLAGAVTWYFVREPAASDQAPRPDKQMAAIAEEPSGDSDTVAVAALGETSSETGILNVSLRYQPFDPAFGPWAPHDGRPAPFARVLVAPLVFNEKLFSTWCRNAGMTEEETRLYAKLHRSSGGMMPQAEAERNRAAGAKLRAYFESKSWDGRQVQKLTSPAPREDWIEGETDEAGHFQVSLKPGLYAVQGRGTQESVSWKVTEFGRACERTRIQAGGVSERTIWLMDLERTIRGRVIDAATGEPIPEVRVKVSSPLFGERTHKSGWTDESGAFFFRRDAMPEKGPFTLEPSTDEYLPTPPLRGEFDPGKPLEPCEFALKRRGVVSGHVWQADGKPAPSTTIVLVAADASCANSVASTDARGYYSFTHDGGALQLSASAISCKSEEVTLELEPEESVEQDFVLPTAGRVLFDIRTPEGEVPEGIQMTHLEWNDHSHSGTLLKREGDLFILPYLVPSQYNFVFLVKGYCMETLDFQIGPDCTDKEFRITLRKGTESLLVRVLDENGLPEAGAPIRVMMVFWKYDERGRKRCSSSASLTSENANARGEYLFEGLLPGNYCVSSGTAYEDVVLPRREALVLKKSPKKMEALYVHRDAIRAYDSTRDDRLLLTEGTAVYTAPPSGGLSSQGALEVGDNRVFFIKRGYTIGTKTVHVSQAVWDARVAKNSSAFGEVEMRIGKGESLYGVAEHPDGTPWADQKLQVYPAELWEEAQEAKDRHVWGDFGHALAQGAGSDETGAFEVRHLPPGQYMIAIQNGTSAGPFEVLAEHETGPVVLQKED